MAARQVDGCLGITAHGRIALPAPCQPHWPLSSPATFEQLYKEVAAEDSLEAVKATLGNASQDQRAAWLKQTNSDHYVSHRSLLHAQPGMSMGWG